MTVKSEDLILILAMALGSAIICTSGTGERSFSCSMNASRQGVGLPPLTELPR
jgi:hypothetical protein